MITPLTKGAAAAVALALTLTGCEGPTPTATSDALPAAVSAAKASRTDGAFVFRGRVHDAVLMVDFDRERTLVVGHSAAQLAEICATGAFPEEITVHDVNGPKGVLHVLIQTGPLPAVVWSALSFNPCLDLQGVEPLAEGTAHAIYTDNDLFGSGTGASSFGLKAQGRLTE